MSEKKITLYEILLKDIELPEPRSVSSSDEESVSSFNVELDRCDNESDNSIENKTIKYDKDFVYQIMLTCIGNKRKIVPYISDIVKKLLKKLKKEKLKNYFDFFGFGFFIFLNYFEKRIMAIFQY